MLFVCRKRIVLIYCAILEPAAAGFLRRIFPCASEETV